MTFCNLQRIQAETFVRRVEYREELDSTSDLALRLAADVHSERPLLVLADRQLRGRGRGENRWWTGPGALTFSLVVDISRLREQSPAWSRISLATALAVCDTILERWTPYDARIKWPNDVFLQGRKVCGILVETAASRPGSAVIGVGINVNNSLRAAPPELRDTAIALVDVLGEEANREDLLVRLLQRLAGTLLQLESESLQLSDRWQQLCLLHGRTVCVESGGRRNVGVCQGIDEQGALLVLTESGAERFLTGTIARVL